MNILSQNAKMKKTAEKHNAALFNFGIPAFLSQSGVKTCPNAGHCAAGCYAKSGAYLWDNVKQAYEKRLTLTQDAARFFVVMSDAISKKIKAAKGKKVTIRIHDSGDFYSIEYFNQWQKIMKQFESVSFYAYTKQIDMFKNQIGLNNLPDNFTLIFSFGGKQDNLIDVNNDRHSLVFETIEQLTAAGYVNASDDDFLAIGQGKKIGLVYHGAKNFNNTFWHATLKTCLNNLK